MAFKTKEAYNKQYYASNRDKLLEDKKRYRETHRAQIRLADRKRYIEHRKEKLKVIKDYGQSNPLKLKETRHKTYLKHRQQRLRWQRTYETEQYKTNIEFRLRSVLRKRFYIAIKCGYKRGSAVRDLGCTIEEFKFYIQKKFVPDMSWENYGEWHLDHIKSLAKFDLTKRSQVLKACHYTNYQPLWAIDNLRKGAK
jgi:hypothetical protein